MELAMLVILACLAGSGRCRFARLRYSASGVRVGEDLSSSRSSC